VKIVISGYGKMGREIEKTSLIRGHEILAKLDLPADWQANSGLLGQADMVIDFSTPDTAVENIRRCFDLHLPVVVGTTGWNEEEEKVKRWCAEEMQAIFVASNFSVGINILYSLARQLSEIVNKINTFTTNLNQISIPIINDLQGLEILDIKDSSNYDPCFMKQCIQMIKDDYITKLLNLKTNIVNDETIEQEQILETDLKDYGLGKLGHHKSISQLKSRIDNIFDSTAL